jgi:hypothetical protein
MKELKIVLIRSMKTLTNVNDMIEYVGGKRFEGNELIMVGGVLKVIENVNRKFSY